MNYRKKGDVWVEGVIPTYVSVSEAMNNDWLYKGRNDLYLSTIYDLLMAGF